MRPSRIITSMFLTAPLLLGGCMNMSEETKADANGILCKSADVLIAQLNVGGAVTKTAAGMIADNSNNEYIVSLAKKVQSGDYTENTLNELSKYLNNVC